MRLSFNFRHKLAKQHWITACCAYGRRYLVKGQTAQPRLHQRAHRSFVPVNATWMLAMSGVPAYSEHSHNASQAASTRPAWSELQRSMGSMHEALSSLKSTGALSAAQTAYIQALEAQLADRTTGTLRRGRASCFLWMVRRVARTMWHWRTLGRPCGALSDIQRVSAQLRKK
jgi:hypothetical protein